MSLFLEENPSVANQDLCAAWGIPYVCAPTKSVGSSQQLGLCFLVLFVCQQSSFGVCLALLLAWSIAFCVSQGYPLDSLGLFPNKRTCSNFFFLETQLIRVTGNQGWIQKFTYLWVQINYNSKIYLTKLNLYICNSLQEYISLTICITSPYD